MSQPVFDIALVGATGVVGEAFLNILEERQFPIGTLYPLASKKSEGESVFFKKHHLPVQNAQDFDFSKAHLAFFSAGASVSAALVPSAQAAGCIVIDNTSQFRLQEDVPLVIPEVNPERIEDYRNQGIIANPNCSTIQLLVALKPIYDAVGITRVNVATYQSVSGTGKAAISELIDQLTSLLSGQPIESKVYPKQIAFNVIPHIDDFVENGYTKEEMKVFYETQKILGDPNVLVNTTAVRVPVLYGHSEAVHLETKQKISAEALRHLFEQSPGIIVLDDMAPGQYPTPIPEATTTDAVYIGRIREDISHPLGLNFWLVSDNIRKGAALNAVQIAEILVKEYM